MGLSGRNYNVKLKVYTGSAGWSECLMSNPSWM